VARRVSTTDERSRTVSAQPRHWQSPFPSTGGESKPATASCLAVTAAAHNFQFSILHSQFLDALRPFGFVFPKLNNELHQFNNTNILLWIKKQLHVAIL
jgi:hypothetical protein